MHTPQELEKLILEADKIGVRLEMIGGLPVWETSFDKLKQTEFLPTPRA
jgi:hypothetical protein